MKKTLSILLALVMSFLMIPMSVFASDVGSVEAGYAPSENSIAVSTVAEFEAMGGGKSYHLTNDIDFSAKNYDDFIIEYADFTLDGCGYSLLGLNIKHKNTINAGIFFDTMAGTVIKNLVIGSEEKPAVVEGEGGSTGVLMVAAKKSITVKNLKVYGTVSSTSTSGGIFGYVAVDRLEMTDCEFNGTVTTTGGRDAGGIIGRIRKCNTVEITNVVNNGTVYLDEPVKERGTGGIIGITECALNLTDCVNNGTVTTEANYAGGILGCIRISDPDKSINIIGCSNNGVISGMYTGKTADNSYSKESVIDAGIGGIVGGTSNFAYAVDGTLTIDGCMNYGTVKTNGVSAAAIVGKGVNTENSDKVYRIIIKNTGNVGRVEYGVQTESVGIFVSVASTNLEGSIQIFNSFNIGTTNSSNACAALYNINGDTIKGNATVSDFYFLNSVYSKAANSQNVKIVGSFACSEDAFASGEIAYVLGLNFGQRIGTDAYPIPGGPALTLVGTEYVNVSNLSKRDDGGAAPYIQTTDAVEGKQSVRFIIAVDASAIEAVSDAQMTIVFSKSGSEDVSYTLTKDKIHIFKSVSAADNVYLAADGSAILGVLVENIVEAEWESVTISLTATSSAGNAITALTVSADYVK